MSTLKEGRAIGVLCVVGAMLLVMLASVAQANAATIYACQTKKGTIRIVTAKTKCKRSEKKLSWSTTGPAGANGANGKEGSAGKSGENGKNLTSQTPLASGQSESGAFAVGDGESKSCYIGEGITFSQPLAAAIPENHVVFNLVKETTPQCAGPGHAAPGYVCLYESEAISLTFFVARDFALDANAADTFGFAVFFEAKAAAGYAAGTWTVTAP
jgi:hypothetical protein